jgi:hypothetical protein
MPIALSDVRFWRQSRRGWFMSTRPRTPVALPSSADTAANAPPPANGVANALALFAKSDGPLLPPVMMMVHGGVMHGGHPLLKPRGSAYLEETLSCRRGFTDAPAISLI